MINKVAKTLGVEVGKQFIGKDKFKNINVYRLCSDGTLRVRWSIAGDELVTESSLYDLLTGKLTVVELPKKHEFYYLPRPDKEELYLTCQWGESEQDINLYERGLVYKHKEEAIKAAETMLESLVEK